MTYSNLSLTERAERVLEIDRWLERLEIGCSYNRNGVKLTG